VNTDSITLGGQPYPIGPFTLGDVQQLLPQFKKQETGTVEGAAATMTIISIGVRSGSPHLSPVDVQNIRGVVLQEMNAAVLAIGLKVGVYVPKDAAPGEAKGEESP
jgi:hypothetical protein